VFEKISLFPRGKGLKRRTYLRNNQPTFFSISKEINFESNKNGTEPYASRGRGTIITQGEHQSWSTMTSRGRKKHCSHNDGIHHL